MLYNIIYIILKTLTFSLVTVTKVKINDDLNRYFSTVKLLSKIYVLALDYPGVFIVLIVFLKYKISIG